MKEALKKCDTLDEVVTRFSDFHQALQAADELLAYLNLAMFIGDEGATLQNTMRELALLLTPYFAVSEHSPCSLPVDFAEKRHAFNKAVNSFKKAKHIDFIKVFFAILTLSANFYDQSLQSLAYLNTLKNSLVLTDEVIQTWLSQHQSDNVIDISPYEINRILLQALLVAPSDWTLVYRSALSRMVSWLLQPATGTDASSQHLRAIQATYPKQFLANLLLLTLIAGSDLRTSEKNALYQTVLGVIDDSSAGYRFFFRKFLGLIFDRARPDQFMPFWTVVQPHLPTLIQRVSEILSLLDRRYLTADECTQILTAVQLAILIRDAYELRELLDCEYLTADHRTQIWTAIEPNLAGLVQRFEQFLHLFKCEYLTDTQRTQIWTTIQPNLARFVQSDILKILFLLKCVYLTDAQRTQILTAVQPHLANLVETIPQFEALLKCEFLTDAQRTQILTAVLLNLANLVQSGDELQNLLDCKYLTADHRTQIWTAVQPNLVNLVTNAYEPRSLLNGRFFNAGQCTQNLTAIPKNIVEDYQRVFSFSMYNKFQTPARAVARRDLSLSTLNFLGSSLASAAVNSAAAAPASASGYSRAAAAAIPSSSTSASSSSAAGVLYQMLEI